MKRAVCQFTHTEFGGDPLMLLIHYNLLLADSDGNNSVTIGDQYFQWTVADDTVLPLHDDLSSFYTSLKAKIIEDCDNLGHDVDNPGRIWLMGAPFKPELLQ